MGKKIYVLTLSQDSFTEQLETWTLGAFRRLDDAREACVDAIVGRVQGISAFADSFWNDENNGDEVRGEMCKRWPEETVARLFERDELVCKFPEDIVADLRRCLARNIFHYYWIYCSDLDRTYHFDILETELK